MAKELWHSIEATQVLKELETDLHQGLTEEEVKSALKNMAIMN